MRKRKAVSQTTIIAIVVILIIAGVGGWYLTRPSEEPEPGPEPEPEPEENIAPIAAAYIATWAGEIGENIEFDASGSRDPDGQIVKYTWDFGDGNTEETTSDSILYSYDTAGRYIVIVTVEDDGGLTDTTKGRGLTFVSVTHPETEQSDSSAPTAILAVEDDILDSGDSISFDASSSWGWVETDSGVLSSTDKIVKWVVEFGDGEQTEASTAEHTYTDPGQYVSKLTVTDTNGLTDSVQRTIHVLSPEAEYEGVVKNPDTLTIAHGGFPTTLDPAEAHQSPQPGESLDNMYDKLVWFKEDLKSVEPWLAESWDISEDGLTYTFYLREGVLFHDGTELTAEDVEYTFERQMAIYIPEGHISMILGSVLGTTDADEYTIEDVRNAIEVVDDYTVVFHMAKPFAPFMKLLTDYDFCIINKDLCIANGGIDTDTVTEEERRETWLGRYNQWMSVNDAGSGAYKLVEYVPGQRLVFEAFEDYWQGEASIKRVVCLFVSELSTRLMMLKNGDADVAVIPESYRAQVEGVEGLKVYAGMPSNTANFIIINFNIDTSQLPAETAWLGETGVNVRGDLFQDLDLRKALAYAFPYDDVIQQAYMGVVPKASGPVPPGWLGYTTAYNYTYDPVKAEEHFRAAWDGQLWEEGFTIPLYYTVGGEADRIACELLHDRVAAINDKLNILVSPVDNAVMNALEWTGKCPIVCSGDWINYPDPHIAYEQQMSSYSLFQRAGRYKNDRVDELVALAYEETDEAVREAMYLEIGEYCYSEVPLIYRVYATEFFVCRSWLQGYFSNPFYSYLYWHWLSK
jgi:peptide/nickel transport system substrate-binding protein